MAIGGGGGTAVGGAGLPPRPSPPPTGAAGAHASSTPPPLRSPARSSRPEPLSLSSDTCGGGGGGGGDSDAGSPRAGEGDAPASPWAPDPASPLAALLSPIMSPTARARARLWLRRKRVHDRALFVLSLGAVGSVVAVRFAEWGRCGERCLSKVPLELALFIASAAMLVSTMVSLCCPCGGRVLGESSRYGAQPWRCIPNMQRGSQWVAVARLGYSRTAAVRCYLGVVVAMVVWSVTWLVCIRAGIGFDRDSSLYSGDAYVAAAAALWGASPIAAAAVTSVAVRRRSLEATGLTWFRPALSAVAGMVAVYLLPIVAGTVQFGCFYKPLGGVNATQYGRLVSALGIKPLVPLHHHAGNATPSETQFAPGLGLGLSFVFYSSAGIVWDPTPPASSNLGSGMGWEGMSWVFEAVWEEAGWQGVLFPELYHLCGRRWRPAALCCAAVWPLWHWSYILFGAAGMLPPGLEYKPGSESTPTAYGLVVFTITLAALRVVICWSHLRAGNIWLAVVTHAAHNSMSSSYWRQLQPGRHTITGNTAAWAARYGVGESGAALALCYSVAAALLLCDSRGDEGWHARATRSSGGYAASTEDVRQAYARAVAAYDDAAVRATRTTRTSTPRIGGKERPLWSPPEGEPDVTVPEAPRPVTPPRLGAAAPRS